MQGLKTPTKTFERHNTGMNRCTVLRLMALLSVVALGLAVPLTDAVVLSDPAESLSQADLVQIIGGIAT